jgi:hypothetical protein
MIGRGFAEQREEHRFDRGLLRDLRADSLKVPPVGASRNERCDTAAVCPFAAQ